MGPETAAKWCPREGTSGGARQRRGLKPHCCRAPYFRAISTDFLPWNGRIATMRHDCCNKEQDPQKPVLKVPYSVFVIHGDIFFYLFLQRFDMNFPTSFFFFTLWLISCGPHRQAPAVHVWDSEAPKTPIEMAQNLPAPVCKSWANIDIFEMW